MPPALDIEVTENASPNLVKAAIFDWFGVVEKAVKVRPILCTSLRFSVIGHLRTSKATHFGWLATTKSQRCLRFGAIGLSGSTLPPEPSLASTPVLTSAFSVQVSVPWKVYALAIKTTVLHKLYLEAAFVSQCAAPLEAVAIDVWLQSVRHQVICDSRLHDAPERLASRG